MKRKFQILISAAASVLAFSSLAQNTTKLKTDGSINSRDRIYQAREDQLNGVAKASDVIGMTVQDHHGEKLGKVEELALDVESGRIVQVILSTGGLLGVGDTLRAVPPGALHHDVANKVLHLDADREKLKAGPRFEMSKWAEDSDVTHLSAVYHHYGQGPAFNFTQRGDINRIGQSNAEGSPNSVSAQRADGTWDKNHTSSDRQSMIPSSRLVQLQKTTKIMGTPVKSLQDDKLGKVENFLVDLASGRVVVIIVSSGGFLGMGDELSAIPPTALRYTTDHGALQLDTSKEMLSSAPHFKANQWPDFGQPSYTRGVYSAYKLQPYFTTNVTTEADNTERNVSDRKDRTLTPLDQGNSKTDVAISAQIRKEIIAGKDMSVNAKNVKIITNNGRVTLRGPVNTAEEKRLIGEFAVRIATSEKVDNQLEVKFITGSNN